MNFQLTDSQKMLQGMAREFMEAKCMTKEIKDLDASEAGYSTAIYKEMADLGLLGIGVPEEYGGSGSSLMDIALYMEECGRAALPGPQLPTIVYGGMALVEGGSEEQKRELLPRIVEGDLIFVPALFEPEVHYDLKFTSTKAIADPSSGQFKLTGTKLFVPYAQTADYLVTLAKTSSAEGAENLTLFLVKRDAPGVNITALGSHGTDKLFEVEFRDVVLTKADVVGGVNNGWDLVQKLVQRLAALQSVEMVGLAQRALDLTSAYVKEREQFGVPIGSFQAVKHRAADMYISVEGARLAAYQVTWRIDNGLSAERELAIAKTFIGKAGLEVSLAAHHLHGGIGVDMDYILPYITARAIGIKQAFGSAPKYEEICG